MNLLTTDDDRILADHVAEVLDNEGGVGRLRAMRDRGEVMDRDLWALLVEQGLTGLMVAEDAGGLGLGLAEAAIVAEVLGRSLAAVPLQAMVTASWLGLDGVAEGAIVPLAWRERATGRAPAKVLTAVRGGRLFGRKVGVVDGNEATGFVVSAVEDGEVGLWRVDRGAVEVRPTVLMDHRDVAEVLLDGAAGVRVGGLEELERALDAATVALCAEMLGGLEAVFEATKAYLHTRRQFGVPIGSFQAVQHRLVDVFVEIELARTAVRVASLDPSPAHVSMAKARCSEAYLLGAKEAVQLHGGIGMTDECDVGFFLKRAAVAAQRLGTAAWHRDRWARVHGY